MTPHANPRLDVALAIRNTALAFARDFAGVVIAGFVLVTLPSLLVRVFTPTGDWDTLAFTVRGVLGTLYVALVSWGVVARLRGRALPPAAFIHEGLRRAQPGVKVALLVGAGVVAGLTLQLFAQSGTAQGWLLDCLLLVAALWAACVLMPLVPAAVVERLGPVAAFQRAAALTTGNRGRILALAIVVALTLAPSAALVTSVATPDAVGLWLRALFELLAWSLIATVPAVVYAGLGDAG